MDLLQKICDSLDTDSFTLSDIDDAFNDLIRSIITDPVTLKEIKFNHEETTGIKYGQRHLDFLLENDFIELNEDSDTYRVIRFSDDEMTASTNDEDY